MTPAGLEDDAAHSVEKPVFKTRWRAINILWSKLMVVYDIGCTLQTGSTIVHGDGGKIRVRIEVESSTERVRGEEQKIETGDGF